MGENKHNPRVLMIQHGARRRYAVPRMLEQAGMLAGLYTDSSAYSLHGRCCRLLGPLGTESMKRLARRKPLGIPIAKIHSVDLPPSKGSTGTAAFHKQHVELSKRMRKWGHQDADVVYSMYHEALDFIRWAKGEGLRSIADIYISPATRSIMFEESAAFPDWGEYKSVGDGELADRLWKETTELADILLCPSEWVASGVARLTPEATPKIRIVPYGCSIDYGGRANVPVKGRVLFAGGNPLRKGLHYLGRAATELKTAMPEVEIRVAGKLPENVVRHPVCKDLVFLGKLPADHMKQEFLSADMFVLPSLSEGFAGVVAEAIGAGCPVIVTYESGSPVVHEREGLVIPSRDPGSIVSAVRRLVEDRELRDRLAAECRNRFSFYSQDEWQKRLVACIDEAFRMEGTDA